MRRARHSRRRSPSRATRSRLRLAALVRDREIVVGLPAGRDPQVEGGANRRGHGRSSHVMWRVENNSSNRSPNQASNTSISASVIGTTLGPIVGDGPSRRILRRRPARRDGAAGARSRRDRRGGRDWRRGLRFGICGCGPWLAVSHGTWAKRMAEVHAAPRRCASVRVGTGAIRAHGTPYRLDSHQPGRRQPVKAASRRSRARERRVGLTGWRGRPGPLIKDRSHNSSFGRVPRTNSGIAR